MCLGECVASLKNSLDFCVKWKLERWELHTVTSLLQKLTLLLYVVFITDLSLPRKRRCHWIDDSTIPRCLPTPTPWLSHEQLAAVIQRDQIARRLVCSFPFPNALCQLLAVHVSKFHVAACGSYWIHWYKASIRWLGWWSLIKRLLRGPNMRYPRDAK